MKNWILILSVFAAGCQTVLDVEVPTIDEKPVLYASFNSMSLFHTISLTKSKPLINNSTSSEFEDIKDAKVEIVGNGKTYNFTYTQDGYQNTQPFDLTPGETYTLTAKLANGELLTAQQKMLSAPANLSVLIDSSESDWGNQYDLEMKWNDNTNEVNFYRVEAFSIYENDTNQVFIPQEFFDDTKANNGVFQLKTELFAFVFDDKGQTDDYSVFVVVSQITEDHYNYGIALQDYNPTNPFSEPKPLPKNVEGGLGMFTLSGARMVKIR